MTQKVLVTGGTGYVAGWCIVELLERGYSVRTTLRDLAKADALRAAVATRTDPGERLEFARADLVSPDGWAEALAGIDHVLHVASPLGSQGVRDADELVVPAREGVRNVLRAAAAAGVKRVVMTSAANAASPSEYTAEGVYDETTWTDPDDPSLIPYRRSKTVAERTAWDLAAEPGAPELVTVLPGAVFGPILSTSTIGSVGIIARILRGEMPGMPKIGLEVVDVRDLADLHVRAMEFPAAAGERFLGTGELMWMVDVARTLRNGLDHADGARVRTRELPNLVVRLAARRDPALRTTIPALGRRSRHTTAKAENLLGWHRRPAQETVLDCARSLVEHGVV
ncbi:NAD-dependent epimerase/dehydratase family protein [Pseudonocardia sp. CA-107938]|uniref:NAD-dependent epimerase/dehydratase family protein n=1 Tax=Pseudonocardia sp. CA-107938 TaxID=3240021 RepID=UPI003D8F2D4F